MGIRTAPAVEPEAVGFGALVSPVRGKAELKIS
jgi:hypothetical protein